AAQVADLGGAALHAECLDLLRAEGKGRADQFRLVGVDDLAARVPQLDPDERALQYVPAHRSVERLQGGRLPGDDTDVQAWLHHSARGHVRHLAGGLGRLLDAGLTGDVRD